MKILILVLMCSVLLTGCSASSYLDAFEEEMPLAVQEVWEPSNR